MSVASPGSFPSDASDARLAVVVSHPIQYYAPWFQHLAAGPVRDLRVFHLWDAGARERLDLAFGVKVAWDVPLLEGYPWEWVPNRSGDPGTHHFGGLDNPDLVGRLAAWQPDGVLLFGYAWKTHLRVLLSPKLRRVPILLRGDSHLLASPPRGGRGRVTTLLRRMLFRRVQGFLAVGQANAEFYRWHGVPDSRIFRVPHCVDNQRFAEASGDREAVARWRSEAGIAAEEGVFLFAGKFEEKKRPLDLVEAYRRWVSGLPPGAKAPVLLMVGQGALQDALRARAAIVPSPGRVVFVPFQNQSRMPLAYAAANLLVLPSHGPSETWGLAVNEAMVCGCPAVVSSHVGCGPDLVRPGVNGWRFPAGDIDALAGVLREAFRDLARLEEMGRRARQVVEEFSYPAASAALVRALEACGISRRR